MLVHKGERERERERRERERERERERFDGLIDFFIGRMTVLGRGLVFQPVLVTQTCTYNSKIITLTLQIFHPKKKKKKKEKKRKKKNLFSKRT